jgi:Tol biopolymer transport system component
MVMNRAGSIGALVLALALGSCIEPSAPSLRQAEPRIVFMSDRSGNEEIYTMNSDGTNPTRITNNNALDTHPVWSPDGDFIVFQSNRSGNNDVWVMNPDGTGLRNLTNDPSSDENPSWAPDGLRIVFSSNRIGGQAELFVMSNEGAQVTRLTDSFISQDTYPTWSPDGRFIAFQANRNSVNDDIYVLVNSINLVYRYTTAGGADQSPAWSPEGSKIAFTSARDGNFEIYTLDFHALPYEASNEINITNNVAADGRPAWSNDARQLCWMSNRGGSNDIWIMNADGSDPKRLTTDPGVDDFCSIK